LAPATIEAEHAATRVGCGASERGANLAFQLDGRDHAAMACNQDIPKLRRPEKSWQDHDSALLTDRGTLEAK